MPRFQAERTFAWFQKKYRRLVVRWERIAACFEAFLAMATIHLWLQKLIVGLPCCVLVNTKRTLISPQPVVAWQTKRRRGLRPSARVGVVRAHRGSTPA